MRFTRITIIRTKRPENEKSNVNELLQWFGGTLGLFNLRDKDRSCFRIFIVLLKDAKGASRGLSSEDIADKTFLSRGTVVYHLNKLLESGLVEEQKNKYALKVKNLEELVEKVRGDVNQAFDALKQIGKDIDKKL